MADYNSDKPAPLAYVNQAIKTAYEHTRKSLTEVIAGVQATIQTALNSKADRADIPTRTSQLTNDSGFLTEHRKTPLFKEEGGYLYVSYDEDGEGQPIWEELGYVKGEDGVDGQDGSIVDVPTKVSELENDANYVTEDELSNYPTTVTMDDYLTDIVAGRQLYAAIYYAGGDYCEVMDWNSGLKALEDIIHLNVAGSKLQAFFAFNKRSEDSIALPPYMLVKEYNNLRISNGIQFKAQILYITPVSLSIIPAIFNINISSYFTGGDVELSEEILFSLREQGMDVRVTRTALFKEGDVANEVIQCLISDDTNFSSEIKAVEWSNWDITTHEDLYS